MASRAVTFEEGVIQVESEPFPHVILDGWWPDAQLGRIAEEFPPVDHPHWHRFDNRNERKLQGGPQLWGPRTQALFELLGFTGWCEMVRAIFQLEQTPTMDAEGGGYHLIEPGGFLGIHADFNRASTGLWRRVNCLIFLNRQPGEGGELELRYSGEACPRCYHDHLGYFDEDCVSCGCPGAVLVEPVFNRTVMFETSDRSLHGHPVPTGDWWRKSLAAYYYTEQPPPGATPPHSTIFSE